MNNHNHNDPITGQMTISHYDESYLLGLFAVIILNRSGDNTLFHNVMPWLMNFIKSFMS